MIYPDMDLVPKMTKLDLKISGIELKTFLGMIVAQFINRSVAELSDE